MAIIILNYSSQIELLLNISLIIIINFMFSFDFLFFRGKGETFRKKIIFQFLFFSDFSFKDKYFRGKLFRSTQVYIFFMFFRALFCPSVVYLRTFTRNNSMCPLSTNPGTSDMISIMKILIARHSPMIDSSTNIE